MANQRLADLPALGALQAADLIYVVRGAVDYKLDAAALVASLTPDYAGIHYSGAGAVSIILADLYHKIDDFAADGISAVSSADFANGRLIFGAARPYLVHFDMSGEIAAAASLFEVEAFRISQATAAITAISQATPGVVTAPGHGFSNGHRAKITVVVGMTEVNDKVFTVAGVAGDDFALTDAEGVDVATGGYGAWISGGTVARAVGIVEISRDFPNGSVGSSAASFPVMGVAGDAVELYAKNEDNVNDITVSQCHLWISAL
jgi:hypothetical protein